VDLPSFLRASRIKTRRDKTRKGRSEDRRLHNGPNEDPRATTTRAAPCGGKQIPLCAGRPFAGSEGKEKSARCVRNDGRWEKGKGVTGLKTGHYNA
jgi:hypothetical protein